MKATMPSRAKMALMTFMVWLPFTCGHPEVLGTMADPKTRGDTPPGVWTEVTAQAALGVFFLLSFPLLVDRNNPSASFTFGFALVGFTQG